MPVVDGFIYLRHSKVWADQEDGTFKINLPFLQHQAPHSWGFLFVGGWVDLGTDRRKNMETFGIIGFVFGLSALAKVIMLENRLKESGVLKEKKESDDK